VIIEPDGSCTLRGDNGGAEFLDLILLDEPDAVIASLRSWRERDWWYEHPWDEGGVLVNLGTRELVFFGGFTLVRTIPMRRRYVQALGAVWAGWQVRWAWRHTADILDPIGLAPEPFDVPLPPAEWADAGLTKVPSTDRYGHLLSVRDPAGNLRLHWAPHWGLRQTLTAGPAILSRIGPGGTRLTLPDPVTWGDGAHIDLNARSLACWSRDGLQPPPDLDRTWPGWRLSLDDDRYENQVAQCGGALVMAEPPLEQTISEMIDSLGWLYVPPSPGERVFIETALRR
jgi:hypothetical protein